MTHTDHDIRTTLIANAAYFYQRGWMMGTAGNLSARSGADDFWVTASGCAKGELRVQDFVRVSLHGDLLEKGRPDAKPSAETSLHQAIYTLYPEACACYHVHSVEANLASHLADGEGWLPLPPIEMLKGFGIMGEAPSVRMRVLPNHAHVPDIAADMLKQLTPENNGIPAFLIRDHGVTVWAKDQITARHYVELAEYTLRYIVMKRQLGL